MYWEILLNPSLNPRSYVFMYKTSKCFTQDVQHAHCYRDALRASERARVTTAATSIGVVFTAFQLLPK